MNTNEDKIEWILTQIAGDPKTSPEVLRLLADLDVDDGFNGSILACVGINPSTPSDILERLARSQYITIRKSVAGNEKAPASLIEKLSQDPIPEVRAWVAANKRASVQILDILSSDRRSTVRLAVAQNKKASKQTLARLSKDKNKEIRDAVESTLYYKNVETQRRRAARQKAQWEKLS